MTDRQIFKSMGFVVLSVLALVFMWEFVIEVLIWPLFLASYELEPLSHRWENTFVATASAAIALIIPTQLLRKLNLRSIHAAQAATTSEAQMRLVTDALPALIAYFDTEQRLQFVNKTFENWYEVPRDEIVGRKIRDVMAEHIAEADYERFRPHVETALSGEEVAFEELVTYPDGKTRNVWVRYVPEFGSGGSTDGAFALIQDFTERKRMEDAVRESEARLSAIIDHAPNAISLKDRRGKYLLINRVFEDMLDMTSGEVRGKTSAEIFPSEFAESGMAHDRDVVEKGRAIEREEEFVLGDRTYTYLTTKFPIRDASGDILSIGAIHTDITERKRSEDALRESETRLRDAAHLASLGQFVWDDVEEMCIYCDEEYARIYGVSVAEYLSTYATYEADLDWVHSEDRERYRDAVFTEASKHRGAIDIEYRIVRRDGETRYIHERGTPVLDEEGALIRTIGTIQDITDRKHTAEALRESEARYRTLASLSPVGIFHTDAQGLVTYVNERWCEIGGMTAEQALGAGWIAGVHPEDREWIAAEWDEAVRNGREYRLEYRYTHREGTVTWCYVEAVAETDADGKQVGYVGCNTDITDRKRAEEALRQAHDNLELRVEERTSELAAANAQLLEEITEREHAEATLKESEAKLREILENSPVGVAVVSHAKDDARATGKRLFINSALVQMFGGASGEDLIEAEISDSWVDLDQLHAVEEIMTSRDELVDFEARRRRLDGTEWWVSMNSRPIRFDDQDCTMVWHFDITERMRTEEALRESEARFQVLLDNAPLEIYLKDTEGRHIVVGRRGEELYGSPDRPVLGRTAHEIFAAPQADVYLEHDRAVLESGRAIEREYEIPFDDGVHSFLSVKFPVPDAAGEFKSIGAFNIDITDRKRAEEDLRNARDELELRVEERTAELRQSEARLRSIMDHAPAEIFLIDTDCRYVLVNREFERRYNLTEEEVKGKKIHDFFPADVSDEFSAQDLEVLETAEPVVKEQQIEYGGAMHTDLEVKFPIVDSTGGIVGAGGMAIDITQRKQIEDELTQFQTHLAHASRLNMVGEMAAGLAHELNQPLAVISSYAQGCLANLHDDKSTPDDLDSALRKIVSQAARASDVVRRIRRFVGDAKRTAGSVDVNAAIGAAFDLLLSEARSRGVTIRLDLTEPSPMAMIDEIELQQVVLNLARNGIDAMSGNGSDHRELIIRTANVEPSSNDGAAPVEVTVQDTGPGVPSDIRERVFDPFFTTKAGGLGLGLSICRSIVDRHDGRLWLDPDDESGAAFHFTVPAG